MAPRNPTEFQWNYTGEVEASSVLETLPSTKRGQTDEALAGFFLVDIASSLRQLRKTYLSTLQREVLADLLRDRFLRFQRLAARTKGSELRRRMNHYLSLLGAYSVVQTQNGDEEVHTLLEAVATGNAVPWTHGVYNAHHELDTRDVLGREVHFEISDECHCAERDARHELMHWLLEEE